jgi:hypothetical protein
MIVVPLVYFLTPLESKFFTWFITALPIKMFELNTIYHILIHLHKIYKLKRIYLFWYQLLCNMQRKTHHFACGKAPE